MLFEPFIYHLNVGPVKGFPVMWMLQEAKISRPKDPIADTSHGLRFPPWVFLEISSYLGVAPESVRKSVIAPTIPQLASYVVR
jgi:hypothetical protein